MRGPLRSARPSESTSTLARASTTSRSYPLLPGISEVRQDGDFSVPSTSTSFQSLKTSFTALDTGMQTWKIFSLDVLLSRSLSSHARQFHSISNCPHSITFRYLECGRAQISNYSQQPSLNYNPSFCWIFWIFKTESLLATPSFRETLEGSEQYSKTRALGKFERCRHRKCFRTSRRTFRMDESLVSSIRLHQVVTNLKATDIRVRDRRNVCMMTITQRPAYENYKFKSRKPLYTSSSETT